LCQPAYGGPRLRRLKGGRGNLPFIFMETATALATDALIDIGACDPFNPARPEHVQLAVRLLNRFMAMHESTGASIGFSPISSASDYLTIPSWASQWLQKELAVLLGSALKKPVTLELSESLKMSRSVVDSHTIKLGDPEYPENFPLSGDYYRPSRASVKAVISGNDTPTSLNSAPRPVEGEWRSVSSVDCTVHPDGVITHSGRASTFTVECALLIESGVNQNANFYIAYQPFGVSMIVLSRTRQAVRLSDDRAVEHSFVCEVPLSKGDAIQLWADGTAEATVKSLGLSLDANTAHR
jgi:hypothetical protein